MLRGYGSLWDVAHRARATALIGAGGKTTALQRLAAEIATSGKSVVQTTTTKIYPVPSISLWQSKNDPPPYWLSPKCFWLAEGEKGSGKWLGPTKSVVDAALKRENFGRRHWVIEADGAHERKLKFWAPHEPQIPAGTECAILILTPSFWGKIPKIEEVHRPEYGVGLGQLRGTDEYQAYLLQSPVFYERYRAMSWVALFNDWDETARNPEGDFGHWDLGKFCSKIETDSSYLKLAICPIHLRIASGDVKRGQFEWYDLW